LEWREKFLLRKVYFDPFQMVSVSQRLAKEYVKVEEFPQTVPNLTAATSNLFDLIQSRSIALYPDAGMRLAISRAIMHESSRGWRLDKAKQAHKIDLVVALSMAAFAAVKGQGESSYDSTTGLILMLRVLRRPSDGSSSVSINMCSITPAITTRRFGGDDSTGDARCEVLIGTLMMMMMMMSSYPMAAA
jgi:hypothetical protein